MAQTLIDGMDNAALWSAFAPDGVTPSTQISMVTDATRYRYGADAKSAKISASTSALNHSLRRSLPNLDLTPYDELRFWVFADRATAGSTFYLEVRMASATVPFTDPSNTWQRYIPIDVTNDWLLVRINITALQASIRSAVNRLQLRCVDATTSFNLWMDDLIAVREEMLADVEAAFVARLNNKVTIGPGLVPAIVHVQETPESKGSTLIRIMLLDIRYSDERTTAIRTRGEPSSAGFSLRPKAYAYDLYYQIDVSAPDRPGQTKLLEFVLKDLKPFGTLLVNDVQVPIETTTLPALEMLNGIRTDRVALLWRVLVREEIGTPEAVKPVATVTVDSDLKS